MKVSRSEDVENTQGTESAPRMGIGRRMIGALFSPGETFASVNEEVTRKDWLVPLIIIAIVAIVATQLTMPIIMTEGMQKARAQIEQNQSLSAEQREEALKGMESMQKVGMAPALIMAPISAAAAIFIEAVIFLALTNFLLGGQGTYTKVLAVTSYSFLTGIPASIITIPLVLIKKTMNVQVGLGLLLPSSMEETLLFKILSHINIFTFWQLSLVAIGLGAVAGVRTKHAVYGVFGLWVIYIVIAVTAQNLFRG